MHARSTESVSYDLHDLGLTTSYIPDSKGKRVEIYNEHACQTAPQAGWLLICAVLPSALSRM